MVFDVFCFNYYYKEATMENHFEIKQKVVRPCHIQLYNRLMHERPQCDCIQPTYNACTYAINHEP